MKPPCRRDPPGRSLPEGSRSDPLIEPFDDGSAMPDFRVRATARKNVTVVLSGMAVMSAA